LYTSGQFAGIFHVSKKLLRHYNEVKLLAPSEVNAGNGYYYYDSSQYVRMKRIMYLRALKMPLNSIKSLLETPDKQWPELIHQHLKFIRSERKNLVMVEDELLLLEEQSLAKRFFEITEKETEFVIRIFHLEKQIWVTGCGVRVQYGVPEYMPAIQHLIENFFGDDISSIIPHRVIPSMRFGVCMGFSAKTGEFTYMMGDQVHKFAEESDLPDTLRNCTITAGDYACITFSAPDIEIITSKTLWEGYDRIFQWIRNSEEWDISEAGAACEVYDSNKFEVPSWPEMDIWIPIKKRQ